MLGTITLTVGQPDGVSVAQKEEAPETMDIQDEVTPQVNGEKVEKESSDANDISVVEEKAAEEKPDDANEVGFKKIFRFVGFKFTLKKDKSEEKEPVKLLTVKDKEDEEVSATEEPTKEEEAASNEEKSTTEEKEADTVASTTEAEVIEDAAAPAEVAAAEATEEAAKEEGTEKDGEVSPPSQETTLSPFRKLFSGGLFSNLRKKSSIKKTKEEEEKEAAAEEETAKTEETAAAEEKEEAEKVTKEEAPATPEEENAEPKAETAATPEEGKSETTPEAEAAVETPAPTSTDETKQEDEKAEPSAEEEKVPAEVISEAELLSSQEKVKPQGSPLKKLFTGAGLKKLSTKKQKAKKETETKLTESGEQAAEHLQSSTESAEAPKAESGPSSPEESGEHVMAVEVTQIESSQETDGEVASDGEKKKEGIIAWSSFKKLVTPKKRVKRSSESDDETTAEKPAKSATLSSSESAPLADKSVEEETKEEKPTEEEPKTENTEKLVSSTEEPKRKMDTSVSWEALMCMGGPKKRTRRTSDSDDEETKIEEEIPAAASATEAEQEGKTESAVVSQSTEHEAEVVSSPEPLSSPPDRESAWDTLKRMVMPKNRTKAEEKTEEGTEQVQSDGEATKDESSFSLKKFLPGRRKKKAEKQASTDQGTGDEDSDTPAVVPLSEYEEAEQEVHPETAAVQSKVSTEDRSPSWIPAMVEDNIDKHDELSDIPEEAENAATPKSVDTDIAEDETEDEAAFAAAAPALSRRRLSTAEMKPIAQAPAAETTPVPKGPKPEHTAKILERVEVQVSEIPAKTSVMVEDIPIEVVSVKTEYEPPTEKAESKTSTILEKHAQEEAVAICTGLGTSEIAKVALEKPAVTIIEPLAVALAVLDTEVPKEEKPLSTEEATVTEDEVLIAQVHQVDTTVLEPVVEDLVSEVNDIQGAVESMEPEIEKIGIVHIDLEESEVVQPATVNENSPKTVIVHPITATSETAICTQSVAITEPTIEIKEEKMDDTEVNTPDAVQKVTEEISLDIAKVTDTAVLEVAPRDEAVITETVVLSVSPIVEADQVETTPVGVEPIQVQETEEATVIDTVVAEINGVIEQASETIEDIQKDSEIEAQSKVIAEAVIQEAMDKVSEVNTEPEKPATPTTIAPAQAVATTEIETTIETPVITNTPVAVVCEKPAPKSPQPLQIAMEVIDTIPLEIVASLDAEEEELKKAVEVNVSEETVIVEEVVEVKAESQTCEELEQAEEEQSKDDTEDKEPAEEVKPETEEPKAEAPSEESNEKVLEVHMPVQVVLQAAQVIEDPLVKEEAVVEFDSNGPATEDTSMKPESLELENKLSTLSEEPVGTASEEDSAPSQDTEATASQPETEKTPSTASVKCAEVMAQVIEVIEEAVKEIEPVSTEITAAS
ncbi:A-kinase anchor protein 12b isoform X2 [Labrus mixtus]|uniref:A-kinase anchor protein 12b isoform X2 n=1 Tax=Labrus mixtus TaxID=508554 RepID=UPI0029BFF7FA|nr:A-kinase anchor protein 12b isoform X2 [Labrus mixtus]